MSFLVSPWTEILTLVAFGLVWGIVVLMRSAGKPASVDEKGGSSTAASEKTKSEGQRFNLKTWTAWINWKLIFAGVVVGILAYLYFFTGVSGDVAGWFASFGELFRNASELETQEVHLIVMVFSMILVGFGLLLILVTRDTRALSDALPWIIGLILVLVVLTKFF